MRRPSEFSDCKAKMAFDPRYRDQERHYEQNAPKQYGTAATEESTVADPKNSSMAKRTKTAAYKMRTKGLFMNDKDMQKIIKHSADFRQYDFKSLLEKN